MYQLQYLKLLINQLPINEETVDELLDRVRRVESEVLSSISKLENKLSVTEQELVAIRKMHEVEPIMPFYNELPTSCLRLRDDRYDLKLAVRGLVERDADRPVIAMSVREYGHPKNFANEVWVDKFNLLLIKDRKALINHVLNTMGEQLNKLFDKETNGV